MAKPKAKTREMLVVENNRMRDALREIIRHHTALNQEVNRPINNSYTIRTARTGLGKGDD